MAERSLQEVDEAIEDIYAQFTGQRPDNLPDLVNLCFSLMFLIKERSDLVVENLQRRIERLEAAMARGDASEPPSAPPEP
jgi:hypothetical protein